METMQPTLKNGRYVWDRINMPAVEFRERVKKITRGMKKEGIDLLLLYGNTFNEYGIPSYVSNYLMRLQRGALVVVSRKGDVALIFEGASRGLPTAKKMTWVEEVRACENVPLECINYLKERKLIPCTVGFVGIRELMPNHQLEFLTESLGESRIVDGGPLLRELRMIKSQRECDQVRRSSRILSRALEFISETPFTVLTERVLEAAVCRETRLEGVEDFRLMIAKPVEGKWAFRPAEEKPFSPGERVLIYLAVEFERYWAECARSYVVKDSSLALFQSDRINSLYKHLIEKIKAGKSFSQFYQEALAEIKKSNLDYIPEYGIGQGLGLSLHEFPVFEPGDDTPLKEGMCFSLRMPVKDKEAGTVIIGNTLCLTKERPEILTL